VRLSAEPMEKSLCLPCHLRGQAQQAKVMLNRTEKYPQIPSADV
jgi:hypothetical protein